MKFSCFVFELESHSWDLLQPFGLKFLEIWLVRSQEQPLSGSICKIPCMSDLSNDESGDYPGYSISLSIFFGCWLEIRVPYILKLKDGMQFKSSAFSKFSSPIVLILPPFSSNDLGIRIRFDPLVTVLSLKLYEPPPPKGLSLIICFFLVVVGFVWVVKLSSDIEL